MDWMLPRITDYWNWQNKKVFTCAKMLERMSPPERQNALKSITMAIVRHTEVLTDDQLATAAYIMAEDLYKGVVAMDYWDNTIADYLNAGAAALLARLADRGYVMRYIIDNSAEPTVVGLSGPAEWFDIWFRAAGFIYICPQQIVARLVEADGGDSAQFINEIPRYIEEARFVANEIVSKCKASRNHYVYLDTDATNASMKPLLNDVESPGLVFLHRKEAPVPGSRCIVKITPPIT